MRAPAGEHGRVVQRGRTNDANTTHSDGVIIYFIVLDSLQRSTGTRSGPMREYVRENAASSSELR